MEERRRQCRTGTAPGPPQTAGNFSNSAITRATQRIQRFIRWASHSILRRLAPNAHNHMPYEGIKRNSLPKRDLRATHDTEYLEKLLSLV